jgi:hypothetical protein
VTLNSASRTPTLGPLGPLWAPINVPESTFFNRLSGSREIERTSYPGGTISLPHFCGAILPGSDEPREQAGRLDATHEAISVEVPPLGRCRRELEGPTTTSGDG